MMKIKSVRFVKSMVSDDELLVDALPKIAFIGRSNVGKSSLINALTNSSVSRSSPFPGSTQAVNAFLINESFYLIDLPGYGFARGSLEGREKMSAIIAAYLFDSKYVQKKIVLIIDASVGMTEKDIGMFQELQGHPKDFIIAASKIDKIKPSEYVRKMREIQAIVGEHRIFPFSSTEKTGIAELNTELFD